MVRPKKHLGQHFLRDENIAKKTASALTYEGYNKVLEIGPGTGVLTKYILKHTKNLYVIEIDRESVTHLNAAFPNLTGRIIQEDFLKFDPASIFGDEQFAVIGNFPYNISSQIVFKVLENRDHVPEMAGMFQKEVARRLCAEHGNKIYGILSVLVQAFFDTEYLFEIPPSVFVPPPKVDSAVIMLKRKTDEKLNCDETLFFKVVKMAFNQRRKTLRNSLKAMGLSDNLKANVIFGKRPEQLSVEEFINLSSLIEADLESN